MKIGNPYAPLEEEPVTWLVFGGMGLKEIRPIPNSLVSSKLERSGEVGISVRLATQEEVAAEMLRRK
jgi:hypothetical protein